MFNFSVENELMLKAEGQGHFFAKKGSMIADIGQFKYSKRLLGTNEGNVVGQVFNHLARRVTGENLEMMEINGGGICYLADQGAHVTVIDLEQSGPWKSICVESEDLLAFTQDCHYGVTPIGVGVLSQKGLFTSKLTYNGQDAKVAIKSNGNPLVLQVSNAPIKVDPDTIVAWTGASPHVKLDVNWKILIGQTSGESYMFEFREPGQILIIQPFERSSGLKLGIDDDNYKPECQTSAYQNTIGNLSNLRNSTGNSGGSNTGVIGNIVGNILR